MHEQSMLVEFQILNYINFLINDPVTNHKNKIKFLLLKLLLKKAGHLYEHRIL